MMTQYVLGDRELSRLVSHQFLSKGLSDPEGYFERMLGSVGAGEGVEDVMTWSDEWLKGWAGKLAASKGLPLKGGASSTK